VGRLMYIDEFKDDYLLSTTWLYYNGDKLRECTFNNWVPEGEDRYYYTGGLLRRISSYKDGMYHGKTEYFDISGNSIALLEFNKGKVIDK